MYIWSVDAGVLWAFGFSGKWKREEFGAYTVRYWSIKSSRGVSNGSEHDSNPVFFSKLNYMSLWVDVYDIKGEVVRMRLFPNVAAVDFRGRGVRLQLP